MECEPLLTYSAPAARTSQSACCFLALLARPSVSIRGYNPRKPRFYCGRRLDAAITDPIGPKKAGSWITFGANEWGVVCRGYCVGESASADETDWEGLPGSTQIPAPSNELVPTSDTVRFEAMLPGLPTMAGNPLHADVPGGGGGTIKLI